MVGGLYRPAGERRTDEKAGMKTRKKIQPTSDNAAYLFYIEEKTQSLAAKFMLESKDADYLQPRLGEGLREAVEKWLVREILFQTDRQMASRAALEYRDLRRAQKLVRNNRMRANLPRRSQEVKDIEQVLISNLNLTWKQVQKLANAKRAKVGKPPIVETGAKDRILNTRTRLLEEAAQIAAMRLADAEDDRLENDSH